MDKEEMFEVFGDFDTWFYECSPQIHANLGRMYVANPRFTKTYEDMRPGLAQYVCDANIANAGRQADSSS